MIVMRKNILVMSNKGGVGKTTVAVNLAYALMKDYKVGILDADIHGPNVPKMLGIENEKPEAAEDKMLPIKIKNLYVMSVGFLTEESNQPIIWRGPLKTKLLRQFISDVKWPELDFLIVDLPPGTGDETITVMQLLKENSFSVVVSTPQEVSMIDAEKAIEVSKKFGIPVIGLVENMSGEIFGSGKIEKFAKNNGINFLGRIELDKTITESSNNGKPFVLENNKASEEFNKIVEKITDKLIR